MGELDEFGKIAHTNIDFLCFGDCQCAAISCMLLMGDPRRGGGVPGATKIASTVGAWASFQRSACSRPPLPTSRMRSGSSPLSTNAMSAGCMPGSDNWFLGQPKGLPVRKLKFRSEERRRSWRTWIVCYSKDQQRPIIFSLITNFFHHRRLHRHESFSLSVRPL